MTCFTITASAQLVKKAPKEEEDFVKIFTKVEIESGPGKDWDAYQRNAAVLPDSVARNIPPATYKALISFEVSSVGVLERLKIDQDPGYGLGQRALEIFKRYTGKWRPANQCGRFVRSYKKDAVVFVVPAGNGARPTGL